MATNINPTLVPRKRIKSLKELRGYALGERNPATYDGTADQEAKQPESLVWSGIRRQIETHGLTGAKYV